MTQVTVDGAPRTLANGPKTWGNLVASVEDAGDRVVTAVRFDGVDQPSCRDAASAGAGLEAWRTIDIDTATRADLIDRSVDSALDGLPAIEQAVQRAAGLFRDGRLAAANTELAAIMHAIRTLVALADAVACARRVHAPDDAATPASATETIDLTGAALRHLTDAQTARDWVAVADVLAFDLVPVLACWTTLFEALRVHPR